MQVRLNGYSNPTGQCGHSLNCYSGSPGQLYCCDSYDTDNCSGDDLCDSYFSYCLRPFGEARQNSSNRCSPNEVSYRARSESNNNDGSLNFSQSRVLGLNNPQNFSGLDTAYNVSHSDVVIFLRPAYIQVFSYMTC